MRKPRKKRKNSETKESPFQHLSPPTDIILLLASTSTALPLPAIPQIPFFVVSWRIQRPVHPLQSHTPQLYHLYPPHPTGHTA